MASMKLRVAELRRQKGLTQQELADVLGISFQSISKWETNVTMPDITLLPVLADYFDVSIDELLGRKPLRSEGYIPSQTAAKDFWNKRLSCLKRKSGSFWNIDYLQFLIEKVWCIAKPVNVLDCGCGYGFLGSVLLTLLPEGSTYTGIDFAPALIEAAKSYFEQMSLPARFICQDVFSYEAEKQYGIVISQGVLRHQNRPFDFLKKMISFAGDGGLVICADVNREIESDGLYIKGLDYDYLCERKGFRKMWKKELEQQGRDYSISMKIPDMMKQLGLSNIDVRLNDKANYVSQDAAGYQEVLSDFIKSNGWDKQDFDYNDIIDYFMNHGMDRKEAEFYCNKQRKIAHFIQADMENISYVHFMGLMISYGIKGMAVPVDIGS